MDISELKRQSDLSYDIAVAKRNALEKAHARQVLAYNGNLFRADPQTICLVRTLKETNSSFFILDTNDNPVEINNADDFLNKLIARNQETLNTYHQTYETFARKR
jgi:predicted lipase